MPQLKQALLSRGTGYICASCIAKFASPTIPRRLRSSASAVTRRVQEDKELDEGAAQLLKELSNFAPDIDRDIESKRSKILELKRDIKRQKIAQSQAKRQEGQSRSDGKAQINNVVATGSKPVVNIYEQQDDGSFALEEDLSLIEREMEHFQKLVRESDVEDEEQDTVFRERKEIQKALTQRLSMDPEFRRQVAVATRTAANVKIPTAAFAASSDLLRLNEALIKEAISIKSTNQPVWKYYYRCRNILAKNWSQVPKETWSLLWQVVAQESAKDTTRFSRLLTVRKDLEAAGFELDDKQMLLYIEALFVCGETTSALTKWKTQQISLTLEPATEGRYWALGARMLAHCSQPTASAEAAQHHLDVEGGEVDITILVPLISAWLSSKDPYAVQKAWATYIRLNYQMGSNMSMEIYSACMGIFLTADRADLAVAVFADMMLTREPAWRERCKNVAVYMSALKITRIDVFATLDILAAEVDWAESNPPIAHPALFKNKFFYHSLIKKLLGDGEIEWATKVGTLMSYRGMPADPKVWNGIIGAWLRKGGSKGAEKGIELAWSMINQRIEFVKRRMRNFENLEAPLRIVEGYNDVGFVRLKSAVSGVRATSETFAILAETYGFLKDEDSIKELFRVIEAAAITPTTNLMNSILQYGVSSDRRRWTWTTFRKMTGEGGVRPNFETFELLWKAAEKNWNPVKTPPTNSRNAGFPNCRSLFCEMIKWKTALADQQIPNHLYQTIITTFGLQDDQIGTGIALRAMQLYLGAYPDEKTVRKVVLQISKAAVTNAAGFRPRRLDLNAAAKTRVKQVAELMEQFQTERLRALEAAGTPFEELQEQERDEETVLLLCDVLRHVVQQRTRFQRQTDIGEDVDPVTFRKLAEEAAIQMGIIQDIHLSWYSPNLPGASTPHAAVTG